MTHSIVGIALPSQEKKEALYLVCPNHDTAIILLNRYENKKNISLSFNQTGVSLYEIVIKCDNDGETWENVSISDELISILKKYHPKKMQFAYPNPPKDFASKELIHLINLFFN